MKHNGAVKEIEISHVDAESESDDAFDDSMLFALTLSQDEAGQRLDKVLSERLPQFSRSRIQQWIEQGLVTIDEKPVSRKQAVHGYEDVVVNARPSAEEMAFQPEPVSFTVVYEDEAIIVIDKPAGLVVHPAAGNWSGTLLNGLLYRYPQLAMVPRAGIVHRLDKETSGLMVVTKTLEAQTSLVRQLQDRTVSRIYLALVWGETPLSRTVEAAMARHPRDRIKMAVSDSVRAKPAVTRFQRLATGELDGKAVSLLQCQLETGRTHQIRVHMQHLGFPLVGDPLYGKPHLASIFGRQALHAARLGLNHPVSERLLEWESPLPPDLAGLLEDAGIHLA